MPPPDLPTSAPVNDLLDALAFADRRFSDWQQQGQISGSQFDAIKGRFAKLRDRIEAADPNNPPALAGLAPPVEGESGPAHSIRYWHFVRHVVSLSAERNVLRLTQAHALLDEISERQAALSRKLRPDEISEPVLVAELADDEGLAPPPPPRPTPPKEPPPPRRSLLEYLLDPRNIQYLLAFGAALMVVGVVILLWVNELITPMVMAIGLGAVNAAVMVAGWYLIRATKFHGAGRALTLLACLVMPLNLWYLHANNLVLLERGLWIVAVAITLLYFASALVLRDEMFVWVSSAGVTMAGLLILGGLPPSPEKFWEIALPSSMLVLMGLVGIHLERAFPDIDGPFGRKRFGLAFFWSGHLQLATGLLLLLGAFVAGDWLHTPIFKQFYPEGAGPSPVVDRNQLLWLSIALVAVGTYAYIYSDLVVRHLGLYVHIAAGTLLWLFVLVLEQFMVVPGIDMLISVLAGTALVINLVQGFALRESKYTKALPVLGVLLPLAAVLLGLFVYFNHLDPGLRQVWAKETPSWTYLGALALAAVSCRVGAWVYQKDMPGLSAVYHFATAAATMTAAVALLAALKLERWEEHGPILMALPIVYLVASWMYKGGPNEKPMLWVAHAATGVMLIASLASALVGFTDVRSGQPLNLMLALFFAEVALFYALAAGLHKQVIGVHLCAAAACGAVWQLFNYQSWPGEAYTLVFAVVGLGLLLAYRLMATLGGPLARAAFQTGNVLLSLSFVSAALICITRMMAKEEMTGPFKGLLAGLTLIALLSIALVRERAWRRWYVVATIGLAALTFLAMVISYQLTAWQKAELFSVGIGLLLLIAGHVGWYREQGRERENDLVSVGLLLGSLLVGVPLALATIVDRSRDELLWYNEIGWLVVAVLLFVSGFTFRLKATTVVGAILLVLYFVTLLVRIPWSRLNTVALTMTIGGGSIFALGLILSVFRERLLDLPKRIKNREGMFRVLNWR